MQLKTLLLILAILDFVAPIYSQTPSTDLFYYHRENWVNKEELIGLTENKKDDFISGVQSPYEQNVWIYASREKINEATSLYRYDNESKKKVKS